MDACPNPRSERERPSGKPLSILVVEDHEDTITYLSRYLEAEGHSVLIARNAGQAAQILRRQRPDLLLCDILLPDRDGWDLMNDLGGVRPPRCVAMSVRGQRDDLDRSRIAGFDHHLTKPFLPEDLDAVLRPL